jgi:tetratricopeptide (TPR) repeat protein
LSRNQYILIGSVAVIAGILFWKGYKTNNAVVGNKENPSSTANFKSFEEYISIQKTELKPDVLNVLTKYEKTNTSATLKQAVQLSDSLNLPLLASYYFEKYTELESTKQNWYVLGTKWYNLAMSSSDSILSYQLAGKAKSSLNKALQLDPTNLDVKNALAACYIELDKDVMKGVGMLREVIKEDSNNYQAIFSLGMLSIQSNQLDKALVRFEKLVSLQPFNPQYYFYLAEVQAKMGNAQQAIKTYEKCKTLVSDKETRTEIDNIIQKLNQL